MLEPVPRPELVDDCPLVVVDPVETSELLVEAPAIPVVDPLSEIIPVEPDVDA